MAVDCNSILTLMQRVPSLFHTLLPSITLHDIRYCQCDDVGQKYKCSLNLDHEEHQPSLVCLVCHKLCSNEDLLELHLHVHVRKKSRIADDSLQTSEALDPHEQNSDTEASDDSPGVKSTRDSGSRHRSGGSDGCYENSHVIHVTEDDLDEEGEVGGARCEVEDVNGEVECVKCEVEGVNGEVEGVNDEIESGNDDVSMCNQAGKGGTSMETPDKSEDSVKTYTGETYTYLTDQFTQGSFMSSNVAHSLMSGAEVERAATCSNSLETDSQETVSTEFAFTVMEKLLNTRERRNYRQNLKRQKKIPHKKTKQHKCQFCGMAYFSIGCLINHQRDKCIAIRHHGTVAEHAISPGSVDTCTLCGKQFQNSMLMIRHIAEVHPKVSRTLVGDESLKCRMCGLFMRTKGVLEQHLMTHVRMQDVTCNLGCDGHFSTQFQLYNHQRLAHNLWRCDECCRVFHSAQEYLTSYCQDSVTKCSAASFNINGCPFCEKSFKLMESFYQHLCRKHFPDDGKFKCIMCDWTFFEETHLKSHVDKCHPSQKLQCTNCSKNFNNRRQLYRHNRDHHMDLKCNICGYEVSGRGKEGLLKEHLLAEHQSGDGMKCSDCDEMFATKHFMERHMWKVHARSEHLCQHCGKACPPGSLYIHILNCKQNDKRRKFICQICGKSYLSKYMLTQHMEFIHENKTRQFLCSQCPKMFLLVHHLKNHVKSVHTKERNFACIFCEKRFKLKHQLASHERIHTGEEPLQCKYCPQTFRDYNGLISHRKRIHDVKTSI